MRAGGGPTLTRLDRAPKGGDSTYVEPFRACFIGEWILARAHAPKRRADVGALLRRPGPIPPAVKAFNGFFSSDFQGVSARPREPQHYVVPPHCSLRRLPAGITRR